VKKIEKKQRITRRWANNDGAYIATQMTLEEDCKKKVLRQLQSDASERAFLCNLIRKYSGN
jgi:hypothetical protein